MMENEEKIYYCQLASDEFLTEALNAEGKLVHVDSVQRGKKCGCICPYCKEPLEAKQGKKKAHHFAHIGRGLCRKGHETRLHLLVKEVLKEIQKIKLPEYRIKKSFIIKKDKSKADDDYITMPSKLANLNNVEFEKFIGSGAIKPDCIAETSKGSKIALEINVTHAVDAEKIKKIKQEGINCLEINLPPKTPTKKEDIIKLLTEDVECKNWINCPSGFDYLREKEEDEIDKYEKVHPEIERIEIENCNNCKLCFYILERKYKKLLADYNGRLLHWAIPYANWSLDDYLKAVIKINGNKHEGTYVIINNKSNQVYPDYSIKGKHKLFCGSTYGFFKKLMGIINEYKLCSNNHYYCDLFHAQFNYKGKEYVFCEKEM